VPIGINVIDDVESPNTELDDLSSIVVDIFGQEGFAQWVRMRVANKKKPRRPGHVTPERVAALASKEPPKPTGRLIGYARVSTDDQKLDTQLDQLRRAGVEEDHLWYERKSGGNMRRPRFQLARAQCVRGDTLVVTTLDRLGRNLKELILTLEDLDAHGIGFRTLNDGIDTTTVIGRFIFHIMGAVAQLFREQTIEKTRRSVASTRRRGVQIGALPKLTAADEAKAEKWLKGGMSALEVARKLGVVRQTILNRPQLAALVPRRKRKPKD
jgi:DNA invertase Pin-like site-specific DNA recombinase